MSLLDELTRRIPLRFANDNVQTHSRYHPQHVYLAPDCGIVIGADRASEMFVHGYIRRGGADLSGLAFQWSYSILFTLVARAGRTSADDLDERGRIEFYEAEFAAALGRAAAYGSRAGRET